MSTLTALFRLCGVERKLRNPNKRKEETKMNPLTHFKKILILPLLSLSAIFALTTAAHAQNLYVSANFPGGDHRIFEYTPDGTQSIYATGLDNPRGLAFDSIGNLFAANNPIPAADNHVVAKALKFNLRNHVSTVGSVAWFEFEGLALDMAGNVYVMATDERSPTEAGTVFKFTPSGERIVFGSVPGTADALQSNWGLAFDSAGILYAADGNAQTIYEFAPDGTRSVFVGPSAFAAGESPVGLTFDSSGNLFVSIETFSDPGADSIVYFTPTRVKSTFATGLTFPRGLAFDSSGNLFVAEANAIPNGDILKFPPGGGSPTVFASGFGRPEFLAFGPPR
jgi:DNA-binding beta-propeller fold protein YncE